MRAADRFEGLTVFLAVARRRSFRAAAKELNVTAGAVSQAVRGLERKVGLPLFQRTTRKVGLTEAGAALLARLEPATAEIDAALGTLDGMRARPSGLLRLTVPRIAVQLFIAPALPRFVRAHPDVTIEISVDDAFVDLAEGGFDAGIRVGEAIAEDMIGVRLTGDLRWMVVGAPSYFAAHGHPATPRDLIDHTSIRYRFPKSGVIYRWELEEDGSDITVDTPGTITVNDGDLLMTLARLGLGLTYGADKVFARDLREGTLVPTLDAYATKSPGFFLYFAAGAQSQPKLRAFIDTLLETIAPAGPRKKARARAE